MNSNALDTWITGNYGEDHPDNQQSWCEAEADRTAAARREGEAAARWAASREWDTNKERS